VAQLNEFHVQHTANRLVAPFATPEPVPFPPYGVYNTDMTWFPPYLVYNQIPALKKIGGSSL
jgi:hypothetical protein